MILLQTSNKVTEVVTDFAKSNPVQEQAWVMFLFKLLIMTLILGSVIYLLHQVFIAKKRIDEIIIKNPEYTALSLTFLTCIFEVFSLSEAAVSRGNSLTAAIPRYAIPALFEVLFAFLFSVGVRQVCKDGKLDKRDIGSAMLCLFAFFASGICTYWIWQFYLESKGIITLISNSNNLIFPDIVHKDGISIELGIAFTIWCTPGLEIVNAIFQLAQMYGFLPGSSKSEKYSKHSPLVDVNTKINEREGEESKKESKEDPTVKSKKQQINNLKQRLKNPRVKGNKDRVAAINDRINSLEKEIKDLVK